MKIILSVLALAIVLIIVFDAIRVMRLIGVGKSLAEKSKPFEQHPVNPTKRILVLGDSTGVGTGADTPAHSVAGYFGETYPDAEIINLSVNGKRLLQLERELATFDQGKFDVVLIQIGGNDIIRFTKLASAHSSLEAILERATKLSDQVILLHSGNVGLAPIFPRWYKPIMTKRTLSVRSIFQELAAKHKVFYIDLFTDKLHDPFYPDYEKYYAPDGLHLNAAGYKVWFEKIQAARGDQPL
jgi:lysophospholipase L1-like esterase